MTSACACFTLSIPRLNDMLGVRDGVGAVQVGDVAIASVLRR